MYPERLDGIKFLCDPLIPKTARRQFRFPRSKKARIRKKWAKRSVNYRDEPAFFKVHHLGDDYLLVHPDMFAAISKLAIT